MEIKRKLATIARVLSVEPIPGADNIEKVKIRGWQVIVKKGEYKVGDLCVYVEIDSVLPERPEFEFLRKNKFHIKTIKLRGCYSQGIVFPLSILSEFNLPSINENDDVTDVLGIKKYEEPESQELSGEIAGAFPSVIPKTDEPRIQNLDTELNIYNTTNKSILELLKDIVFVVSEKIDGQSCTMALLDNDNFCVCSRNLSIKENERNVLWQFARKLQIETILRTIYERDKMRLAIQGEMCGPGIQSNRLQLSEKHFLIFNMFDIDKQLYLPFQLRMDIINQYASYGLESVPILDDNFLLGDNTIDSLISKADGISAYNGCIREGLVYSSKDILPIDFPHSYCGRLSFKTISNEYLVKYGKDKRK